MCNVVKPWKAFSVSFVADDKLGFGIRIGGVYEHNY